MLKRGVLILNILFSSWYDSLWLVAALYRIVMGQLLSSSNKCSDRTTVIHFVVFFCCNFISYLSMV